MRLLAIVSLSGLVGLMGTGSTVLASSNIDMNVASPKTFVGIQYAQGESNPLAGFKPERDSNAGLRPESDAKAGLRNEESNPLAGFKPERDSNAALRNEESNPMAGFKPETAPTKK